VKTWPTVLSEDETLSRVLAGQSIGRYGDGEFKICTGASIKSQPFHPRLAARLQSILKLVDVGDCIVGIPNLHVKTKPFWASFMTPRFSSLVAKGGVYGSAFISRPDSAPWIARADYYDQVESLWRGRRVTLVRGSGKSLTPTLIKSASEVTEILCDRYNAWRQYDELIERIGRPERVLLCCGPTATVMAVDLARRGVHAVDLGHIGMWLKRRHLTVDAALTEGRASNE
jgi:hypothetical protein